MRRGLAGERLLLLAVERGAELAPSDSTVLASCTVDIAIVEGGVTTGNPSRKWGKRAELLVTVDSLVIMSESEARAFPVREAGLAVQGDFAGTLLAGGDGYFLHAYRGADFRQLYLQYEWASEAADAFDELRSALSAPTERVVAARSRPPAKGRRAGGPNAKGGPARNVPS